MSTNNHEAAGKVIPPEAEKPPAPDAGKPETAPAEAKE